MTLDPLRRLPDWRPRLVRYLAGCAALSFDPGSHDCALFGAGAVEAQTGRDLARRWRGYRNLAAGHRALAAAGFDDHVALVASLLPECPVAFGRAGDVAAVDGRDTPDGAAGAMALGVVQGRAIYVLKARGLGLVPLTAAVRMFRVG